MGKRVLLVGHCGPDTSRIAAVLDSLGATFEGAFNLTGALAKLREGHFDLVLPNRVFGPDQEGGLNLIKAMKADPDLKDIPVMLVSGFESAQQTAMKAGALQGFGKNDLETGGAAEVMRPYL